MNWNYGSPHLVGNYVCDFGVAGVRLAWWNGNNWVEMWGSEILNPYGWINVPNHLKRNDIIHK